MAKKRNNKGEGARLVSAAILGLDCKVVIVAGKRYVIQPPTIARLAGAALHLSAVAEEETVGGLIGSQMSIESASKALSQLVCGSDALADELRRGTLEEVVEGLKEAYSLVDVRNFMTLSSLAGALSGLIAKPKR